MSDTDHSLPRSESHPGPARPFVGRARELAVLEDALSEALAGRGGLMLLGGEPGIGKTRLAEELVNRSRQRGARALWGRCWEGGGAPAFAPWVQVLRAYMREEDAGVLRESLRAGRAEIARLLPEIATAESVQPPGSESGSARFRLFDAVTGLLLSAADVRPIIVVVEDLHAADDPSLLLLRYLASQVADSHVLLLATYRDQALARNQPLVGTVAEVLRERGAGRIALRGLPPNEAATFMEAMVGTTPSPTVVEEVHRRTDGNPLFLAEVTNLIASRGAITGDDPELPPITIPAGVREAIAARVATLSEPCREMLELAAGLGREFSFHALIVLAALPRNELLSAVKEATSAGILTSVPGRTGRLRFAHELVREALYQELEPMQRMELHGRIGELLEEIHAADPEPHLAEMAHHFFEAAPLGEAGRAVEYGRRAAERANRVLAFEEAARHYEVALQAADMGSSFGAAERCELLLGLGNSLARAGDLQRAKTVFDRAADVARAGGMHEQLARAALGYGGRFVWARAGGDPHLRPLLEEALSALPDEDGELRVRVMARLAGVLRDDVRREPRWSLSQHAVEMARRLGKVSPLAYALESRYAAIWEPDTLDERLELASEMLASAEGSGDIERMAQAHGYRLHGLFELGDLQGARRELDQERRLTERGQQRPQQWLAAVGAASLALFEGRFAEAEELIPRALALGRSAQTSDAEVSYRLQTFFLRRAQDRLAELEGAITASVAEFPWYPMFRCLLVDLYGQLRRPEAAREQLASLAHDGFRGLPVDSQWLFSLGMLPDTVAFLEDEETAAVLYELLLPYADRNLYSPPEVSAGSASRGLGVMAATLRRWDEAVRHLEDASAANERMGGWPWLAHTQYDHARVLLAWDRPGDRQRALTLVRESAEGARRLGMPSLAERVSVLLSQLGARPRSTTQPQAGPAGGRENVFRREGDFWSVVFDGQAVRLRDAKGLRYLARLLAQPGREIHVLDLVSPGAGGRVPRHAELRESGLRIGGAEDAGDVLDGVARASYRRRIEDLQDEIEEAETWGDRERVARAREEIDLLSRELTGATALGGRGRTASSATERARQSATKALKAVMGRIAEHHPGLGRHLAITVRTGTFCSYMPDPAAATSWQL